MGWHKQFELFQGLILLRIYRPKLLRKLLVDLWESKKDLSIEITCVARMRRAAMAERWKSFSNNLGIVFKSMYRIPVMDHTIIM